VMALLSSILKDLISQYADDALDLESTRKVSDLLSSSQEAEEYFTELQRLRQVTRKTLGQLPPDEPVLNARLFHKLRQRSYEANWWERLAERWVLAPRYAFAASLVLIILILALFSRYEPALSRFLNRTEQKVTELQKEAREGLRALTRSVGTADGSSADSLSPEHRERDSASSDDTAVKVDAEDEHYFADAPGGML